MSLDPLQRFLGLDPGATPAELLGLPDGAPSHSAIAVEGALHRRLAELYNHPDGRSDDAEAVRRRLREAATALHGEAKRDRRNWNPKRWSTVRGLTPFDRHVLAVLVGSGGWNAISRARLIALAAGHGVTSGGLLRVIAGLGRYARHGGAHIGVADIASVRGFAPTASVPPRGAEPATGSDEAPAEEVEEDEARSVWRTIKLSLLFGLLAIVLAAVAVVQLVPWPDPAGRPRSAAEPVGAAVVAPVVETDAPAERGPSLERLEWGVAGFDPRNLPTFHAPVPEAALEARAVSEQAARDLDELARRLRVSDELAEIVFRTWEDVINAVATSWVLLEDEALMQIERGVIEVLSVGDSEHRFLRALSPPAGVLRDPLDVWRGSWKAGLLARAASHRGMPADAAEKARAQLAAALSGRANGSQAVLSFDQAATSWLAGAESALAAGLPEPALAETAWELWIASQYRLGTRERAGGAFISAIGAILRSAHPEAALATADPNVGWRIIDHESAALRVVGRLINEADATAGERMYDRLLALLDDERIHSADLWIITSLFASSSRWGWFTDDLVIAPDAPASVRRRARQDIESRRPDAARAHAAPTEPHPAAGPAPIDPIASERWRHLAVHMQAEPIEIESEESLLRQLVRTARLGEAAASLAAQMPARAERLMDSIETERGALPAERQRRTSVGRAIGTEGGWASQYEDARRDPEERVRLLTTLRASAGGDLHPADAAVFVREVYRGAPADVRNLAQSMAVEQFPRGPNVAREMLDQLPDAQRNPALHDLLQRYTRRQLSHQPGGRDRRWEVEARLALIEHVLGLVHTDGPVVDQLANDLDASYAAQAQALAAGVGGDAGVAPGPPAVRVDSAAGAAALLELWRDRAHRADGSGFSTELAAVERRHGMRLRLAEGPIQETVALRVSALELLALLTRAEQPGQDRPVQSVLDSASRQRRAAPSALLQLIIVERAINELWSRRLHIPEADDPQRGDAT